MSFTRIRGIFLPLIICIAFSTSLAAQAYWQPKVLEDIEVPEGSLTIRAKSFQLFELDLNTVRNLFAKAPLENLGQNDWTDAVTLEIPMPDGLVLPFELMLRHTMHPDLMAKFPMISNGIIRNKTDHNIQGVVDVTYQGFHAMIFTERYGTVFIDPYIHLNSQYYIVYRKTDFLTDKVFQCEFENADLLDEYPHGEHLKGGRVADNKLRIYRTAIAATGEYTAFQGGTVALSLSAINTSNNRVSGLMTQDFAVILQIVPANNLIVYTNGGSDPYTNNNGSTMLGENQTNLNSVINSGNYDFGHVFSTNGGGVAELGSVCRNNRKARGVTGTNAPVGDPFDIDYVAHEMGHQLAENHTFNNSCGGNINGLTAFEPGSGTSIMGYAGICPPDIQSHSDAYYHAISLAETSTFITTSFGNTCGTQITMTNGAPVITIPGGNRTIPFSTPFELTASGTDPNGDAIYYCWEQMNNEIATMPPLPTNTGGPNFRSLSPVLNKPGRTFPALDSILNKANTSKWEVLPSVARTLTFRVTGRDNLVAGGRTDEEDMVVTVSAASGPFLVTTPNTAGLTLGGGTLQTITWSVSNTTSAPVSCTQVDILLSTDGGQTFPIVLADNTPNDGTETVVMPFNTASAQCRIKVKAEGNIFFDINNFNFTVSLALPVELISFTGRKLDQGNKLEWQSANEVQLLEYQLERSSDGIKFELIQTIKPKGTKNVANYEIYDRDIRQSDWYYRLIMVDQDETSAFSDIVFLGAEKSEIKVYPNPATEELFIQWPANQSDQEFFICNIFGQRFIESAQNSGFASSSNIEPQKIDIGFLSPGIYWIKFQNAVQSPILFQKK